MITNPSTISISPYRPVDQLSMSLFIVVRYFCCRNSRKRSGHYCIRTVACPRVLGSPNESPTQWPPEGPRRVSATMRVPHFRTYEETGVSPIVRVTMPVNLGILSYVLPDSPEESTTWWRAAASCTRKHRDTTSGGNSITGLSKPSRGRSCDLRMFMVVELG